MKRPFILFLFLLGVLLGIYACNSAYQPNYHLKEGFIEVIQVDTTDYGDDEETDLQIP